MRSFSLALLSAALAAADVYVVDVGEQGLTFSPKTFGPASGDTVIFHLYPTHDVVQGDFATPCKPSSNGFYSGSFADTDNGKKKFVVNVTDANPVYFYCSVQKHCQSGMVGGWNVPTSGDTIEEYGSAAANVDKAETPSSMQGGKLEEDEQLLSLTSSGAATPSATESGSDETSSPTASEASSGSGASTTPAPSGSASASGSGAAASPSSTAGADSVAHGPVGGVMALVLGIAAWIL